MKPLGADEILDLDAYERARDAFRRDIIALKRTRRVSVGDRVTLVFENRATLLFQVQEMLRVERTHHAAGVQRELDVYNELIPGEDELSATLFVEITDVEEIRPELDRMIGIDEHVSLRIGEEVAPARFDPKQMDEDRISAVQYIRFPLTKEQSARFGDSDVPLVLTVDHPAYEARVEIDPAMRASLLDDLEGRSPTPAPAPGPASAPREEEIFRSQDVRAFRPTSAGAPGLVIVEALRPDADASGVVQRLSAEIGEKHGRCRVEAEIEPGKAARWLLYPAY